MSFKITENTWLTRAKERVGSVLTVHMEHDQTYTAAELVALIERLFPKDTYTTAELITIRDALVVDGVIEIV